MHILSSINASKKLKHIIFLIPILTLLLTACSDSTITSKEKINICLEQSKLKANIEDLALLSNPKKGKGTCLAEQSKETILPATGSKEAKEKAKLPTEFASNDPTGSHIEKIKKTERIVVFDISGAIGESLIKLGYAENIVGKDSTLDNPLTKNAKIVTNNSHTINIENVIALKPDLVITDGTVGPTDVVQQLRDVNIPLIFLPREASIQGAEKRITDLGKILGIEDYAKKEAENIHKEISSRIEEIIKIAPENDSDKVRMAFLYLRGSANIYYLFGKGSGAEEIIDAVGGYDVAEEMSWEGERPLNDEALVKANPDLILVMNEGLASVGGASGLIKQKPSLALTSAGKNNNIISMNDRAILTFGPNIAQTISDLGRAIYVAE